jgi:competence protein ComEA
MEIFSSREKKIILALVTLVLVGVGVKVVRSVYLPTVSTEKVTFLLPEKTEPEVVNTFMVQVVGEVENPGLYNLQMGLRVKDAIDAAGGANDGAEIDALNLALPLLDGMRIYVPPQGAPLDRPEDYITYGYGFSANYQLEEPLLDLNSATVEELMSLPQIGSKIARSIVKYREEQGKFKHKSELLNITGISESVYKEIEGKIEVK